MHTSNPGLRRLTPAAPALGAVLVKTAVASALHNAGGHGVRGDAGTVQAVDSIGLNVVHVRRAAATFGGVRGVAGTVPAAAAIPEVRGVGATPATDPDPPREAAFAVRGDADTPEKTPAVATDRPGATDTASATALEETDGAHHVAHLGLSMLNLGTGLLRLAADSAAAVAPATFYVTRF